MIWTGPTSDLYAGVSEHEARASLLTDEERTWLARMADVLPGGWVIRGMAVPARGGVVPDSSYPGGCRLVVAPPGPGGASRAGHPRPHSRAAMRAIAPQATIPGAPPRRPSPTVGVLR